MILPSNREVRLFYDHDIVSCTLDMVYTLLVLFRGQPMKIRLLNECVDWMPLVTHRGEQGCEQRSSTVTATKAESEAVLLSVHWANAALLHEILS